VKKIQLGAVALMAFLCAACSTAVPATPAATSAPAATTAPVVATPTSQAAASGAQVDEGDVRKVGDALLALKSFSMHGKLKQDDGSTIDWTMEFVKPDRQHTRIVTGGQTIESISIGSADYVKTGPTWTKGPVAAGELGQMLPMSNPDDLAQSFKDSTASGDTMVKGPLDAVDGAQCQEWTITSSDGTHTSACIGLGDNLPRRFTTPGGDLYFSDFNAPLTIEAPI
jgi:hypothetical protein